MSDEEETFVEEQFFNEESYWDFIKKNKLEELEFGTFSNDMRKEITIVPRNDRRTTEIMTLAEYTRVIAERAKQIENGAPIFVDVKNEADPKKIAEQEIREKKCPLKITRMLRKNIAEIWHVNEMVIPFQ